MDSPGLIKGPSPKVTSAGSSIVKSDTSQLTLAQRLKIAAKETLFTHTNNSIKNHTMLEKLVGAGTATYDYDTASVELTVGTASGDRVVRQSYFYMPYLPGSPTRIKATGNFAPSKANVEQYIGLIDDNDGLAFMDNGTTIGIVRRSSVTGTPVDEFIPQASWNVDKLDGTGPSRITLTPNTNKYLFDIEYLWQGAVGYVARIVIDGEFVVVHKDTTNRPEPFMRTATLPVRYEIVNTGVSASPTTLIETCVDVTAEGGHRLVGSDWSVRTPVASGSRRNATTTKAPLLAIRLKDQFNGNDNRHMLKFLQFDVYAFTQGVHFTAAVVHNPTSVTGTWANVDANHSGVEYSTDVSAVTGGDVHDFDDITVPATASRSGEGFSESRFEDTHTIATQNIDSNNSDLIVIYGTALATNTDVIISAKFLEFE